MTQRYSQLRQSYRERARAAPPEYAYLTRRAERLRGLLFRRPDRVTRVLVPCNAVHTVGMTHALDIAFLGHDGTVLASYRKVRPRRHVRCAGARMTLERFASEAPWFTAGERVGFASTL